MNNIPEHLTPGRLSREQKHKLADLYFGGLLAFNLLILQQLSSLASHDAAIFIALLACSIAIPSLSCAIIGKHLYNHTGRSVAILSVIGMLASVVCINAFLWHLSAIAMITFMVTTIISANILTRLK